MFSKLAGAVTLTVVLALACIARADTIYGECLYKDGSKAGGAVSISTSWNGRPSPGTRE